MISSMSELLVGRTRVDPPYLVREFGASEAEYDALTNEELRAELIDGVLIVHSLASLRISRTNVEEIVKRAFRRSGSWMKRIKS